MGIGIILGVVISLICYGIIVLVYVCKQGEAWNELEINIRACQNKINELIKLVNEREG